MNKAIKILLKGTVMILVAVPFLFASSADAQDMFELKLKEDKIAALTPFARKDVEINEIAALTSFARKDVGINEIAALTSFARKVVGINEIAALTPFARKDVGINEIFSLSMISRKSDSLTADTNMTIIKPKEPAIKKFRMKKSPTTAVLLSAVLPGAGQFYNESYWKVPIIGGLVGYFGYEYFRNNNLYKDYRNEYTASQTELNPNGDLNLKTLREFYRDQRDDFVWYFLIVYVINMVDAYVDAHLFDFDVSEDKFTKGGVRGKEYKLKFNLKF
ncbi:MAG: hypothetical protein IAE93_13125 [Ignavibacteria bacterium]|nr:hypothetical protein [Ignavibacteria bacterium]